MKACDENCKTPVDSGILFSHEVKALSRGFSFPSIPREKLGENLWSLTMGENTLPFCFLFVSTCSLLQVAIVIGVFCLYGIMFVGALVVYHTYLIATNSTTKESVRFIGTNFTQDDRMHGIYASILSTSTRFDRTKKRKSKHLQRNHLFTENVCSCLFLSKFTCANIPQRHPPPVEAVGE